MKTISDYTIFCTHEQTRKAYELGATLTKSSMNDDSINYRYNIIINGQYYAIPTAEEMMGWLRSQHKITTWNINFYPGTGKYGYIIIGSSFVLQLESSNTYPSDLYDSYEKATLASIDAVLKYLTNKKSDSYEKSNI